ncbi:MAG: hypothetical protein P4L84_26230 [Isosphaeraceae bacterium]|nr:hypothetical protein [Isosphaeraceae bacterium]
MSVETGDDAAMLQTISELRNDVNRLIDEQLARVRSLEEKRGSEPVTERRFSPPQPAYQPTARPARPSAVARNREPVEEPPKPETGDPSQRLDALARHLDGRLRRSNGNAKPDKGEPTDRPARTSGGTNGAASEATR